MFNGARPSVWVAFFPPLNGTFQDQQECNHVFDIPIEWNSRVCHFHFQKSTPISRFNSATLPLCICFQVSGLQLPGFSRWTAVLKGEETNKRTFGQVFGRINMMFVLPIGGFPWVMVASCSFFGARHVGHFLLCPRHSVFFCCFFGRENRFPCQSSRKNGVFRAPRFPRKIRTGGSLKKTGPRAPTPQPLK